MDIISRDEQQDILRLNNEIALLREQVKTLKTRLAKYTNNDRHKKYYQNNKDKVKQNAKKYIEKLKEENPEKLREYRHKAYLNRKRRESEQIDYAS
tara:strand:+ start:8466 stop:8753 length:288 start_codon:yes stop_codon:yes gene_type:complete